MKQEEINNMSVQTIEEQLMISKEKLNRMVLTHKVAPLENPMQIKTLRRTIARLNTELTKRNAQAVAEK